METKEYFEKVMFFENLPSMVFTPPQPVRERLFGVYHRGQNRYHDST